MIYGKRIRFRHAERSDLPTFVRWLNDPEVSKNLSIYLPISLISEEKWFEDMIARHQDEQAFCIEIQEGEKWTIIGNCSFMDIERRIRSAEVGIFIGEKDYWNKGYGTEAMQLLLKLGFETLNLNRISLRVFETNPHAIHVYKKIGFVHEGTLREAMYMDNQYIDVHIMSVLRSEWKGFII
jgi:RimJ/RimL family protein N-acetyltransferase